MSSIYPTALTAVPGGNLARGDTLVIGRLQSNYQAKFDGDAVVPASSVSDANNVLRVQSNGKPDWQGLNRTWERTDLLTGSPLKLNTKYAIKTAAADLLKITLEIASPISITRSRLVLAARGFTGSFSDTHQTASVDFDLPNGGWANIRFTNSKEILLDGQSSGPFGEPLEIYAVIGLKWSAK